MKCQRYITAIPALIITLIAVLFGLVPTARAMDQVSVDNLQAAMRTLSFLESLPKEGVIAVGVVYPSDIPTTEVLALDVAKCIGTIRGPNSRMLQSLVLSTNALDKFEGHLDVIFLVPGASKHSEAILDAMRRHHLVSISDDPACVDAKCCVLMVRAGQRVEISLNTTLADAVGARFSLVFMMVVKRK
jgi:YfiR/HmsC-like